MLHDSSIGKIHLFLGFTVRMNTTNSVFIFGTITYPLGRTFSNHFMVIIILFSTPGSTTLLTNTDLFLFIVVHRYYFGSRVLCKFVAI